MIIADTGFWVAFFDRNDQFHRQACHVAFNLQESLVTTLPVVTETCYLLQRQIGQAQAVAFVERQTLGAFPCSYSANTICHGWRCSCGNMLTCRWILPTLRWLCWPSIWGMAASFPPTGAISTPIAGRIAIPSPISWGRFDPERVMQAIENAQRCQSQSECTRWVFAGTLRPKFNVTVERVNQRHEER